MVDISASMVKELREKSGAAMMDCKKALVEAQGDPEKAFEWLRQKGMASASKKSSRTASEGLVVGKLSPCAKRGAIVELNCETDFVARNEQFQELANQIVEIALESGAADAEALLAVKLGGKPVSEIVTEKIATIGENIVLRRARYFNLEGEGALGLYIHALGGKMGAIVKLVADKAAGDMSAAARDVAMHVVSAKPSFVSRADISAEAIENERRIELGKEDLAKKPPEIREKIVSGRVDKIFAERCLEEQPFVKDPNQSVGQFLKGSASGANLKPVDFALFILGESVAAEENNAG